MSLEEWRKNVLEGISERHKDTSKLIDEATKHIFEDQSEREKDFKDKIKQIDVMLEDMNKT